MKRGPVTGADLLGAARKTLHGIDIAFGLPFARFRAGETGGNLKWRQQMSRIMLSMSLCTMS